MWSEGESEEISELPVEVTEAALGSREHRGEDIGLRVEVLSENSQSDGLSCARVAGDEGEAAFVHKFLDAPAEVLDLWGSP